MPKGPQGQKRPADTIGCAITVAKIATGEIEESIETEDKNPAAVALGMLGGKKGGRMRAERLSLERRREIARTAAEVRWNKNGNH